MFPLIETVIGFSAIMLVLSFLVKSLTSVIKNHFDFYSRNLKHEVYSLLEGTLEIPRKRLQETIENDRALKTTLPWLLHDWMRLGKEYLTKENITWVLKRLDPQKLKVTDEVIKDLEGRLKVHIANIRYMFEKRLKNIALAVGLALCLALNINAVTMWDRLYHDQDVRAKFASAEFVNLAIERAKGLEEDIQKLSDQEKQGKGKARGEKPRRNRRRARTREREKSTPRTARGGIETNPPLSGTSEFWGRQDLDRDSKRGGGSRICFLGVCGVIDDGHSREHWGAVLARLTTGANSPA